MIPFGKDEWDGVSVRDKVEVGGCPSEIRCARHGHEFHGVKRLEGRKQKMRRLEGEKIGRSG